MALAPYPNKSEKWCGSRGSADSIIIPNFERFFKRFNAWCAWAVARSIGIGAMEEETPRSERMIIFVPAARALLISLIMASKASSKLFKRPLSS